MSGKSTLGTVLVKRKANERPPEWELRLRPACQKIRVVEKLLGGAHAMVTGNPSVAVRIYDADDASRMEAIDDDDAGGADGLRCFRDSFEHSIVFFIFESEQQQRDQLGRRESFVNVAQKSLLQRGRTADDNDDGKKNRTTRTLLVSDASQVIETIESLVQNLKPEKREKRARYFAQVANKHFLSVEGKQPRKEVIANHVTKTFNAWSERFEMESGDANVTLNMFASLAGVATANPRILDGIPIRNSSKDIISRFFGVNTSDADDSSTHAKEDKVVAYSNDDEFYDNIYDSERLGCDPSATNNRSHRTSFPAEDNPAARNGPLDAAPSILPEPITQQNHFPQSNNNAEYCQMTNYGHGSSFSSNCSNYHSDCTPFCQHHYLASAGSQGDGYLQADRDANHAYTGYAQSARYYTQQFM